MEILLTIGYVSVGVFMFRGAWRLRDVHPVAWCVGAGLFCVIWPLSLLIAAWQVATGRK